MKTRQESGKRSYVVKAVIVLCICQLTAPNTVIAAGAAEIVGMIGGRLIDRETRMPLMGVTFEARLLATGELFEATTDPDGHFLVPRLPAGMYAFSVSDSGERYEITETFDVRIGMPFVLESCFEIDSHAREAYRSHDACSTPFVPEARVVTLGPQRFLLPVGVTADMVQAPAADTAIYHEPLECLPNDEFPMLNATMEPVEDVQLARLYFRSDRFTDLYFVDMTLSEGAFYGVLPKATEETTSIHYYFEALGRDYQATRSEDYVADVTTAGECRRRAPVAWFTGGNPGIVVNAVSPGAPAIPAGFQAAGISAFVNSAGVFTSAAGAAGGAAGGGLGALGVTLVVAGAAVGAGGVIAAATGDEEASSPQR